MSTRWYDCLTKFDVLSVRQYNTPMKHVRNRLKQLSLEHGARRGCYYGVRQIARESGASRTVVDRLMRDELRRLPLDDLARLCVWLNCKPGDLLKLEEED